MIVREEYRRFNCYKYKILTNITYGYDKDDNLIYSSCSIKEQKHCNGYELSDRICPYFHPHCLKDD